MQPTENERLVTRGGRDASPALETATAVTLGSNPTPSA